MTRILKFRKPQRHDARHPDDFPLPPAASLYSAALDNGLAAVHAHDAEAILAADCRMGDCLALMRADAELRDERRAA